MRDEVKQKKVTFSSTLPMGTRGTFAHEGELWIAYPASKNQCIHAVIDKLIGIHKRIADDMVTWINVRPQDADLIARVLPRVTRARNTYQELITEKAEAWTE
jgi:isocitrate dehydrogenase